MTPTIDYHYRRPDELGPELMDEVCALIREVGSMRPERVRENLERAFLIGYAHSGGRVVGTVTLKRPRAEYVRAVEDKTGLDLTGYLERGYTSVRPAYRGLAVGATLIRELTTRAAGRPIYVVIASDNAAAQALARGADTHLRATFFSQALGQEVGVWVQSNSDHHGQ
ncbi:MAG: GNAT family N-acetyltransferase [Proteobacteria bacterium]|nr:GNAT family N-acetyltransferase [Pseudomonadota bacterium]MBU1740542.1 GNAT family N-acetyltransferase [Pseudomonadota bacterium]